MRFKIAAAAFALSLAGCAATQNVTSSQIRKPETLRLSETVPMTIQQIQANLFKYRFSCRSIPVLQVDPADPNRALMMIETMGLTRMSVGAVADFVQSGGATKIDYYSYYSTWDSFGKDILGAIKSPDRCD